MCVSCWLPEGETCLFCLYPCLPQNPSAFFSLPCSEVPILPGTCLVAHHRGCAPGKAGLHIPVAWTMVAQEGNKDFLGTTISTCHIPCLVVPFSILWIPSVQSSLVWPISGCDSLVKAKGVGNRAGDRQSTPILPLTAPGSLAHCTGALSPFPGSGLTAN